MNISGQRLVEEVVATNGWREPRTAFFEKSIKGLDFTVLVVAPQEINSGWCQMQEGMSLNERRSVCMCVVGGGGGMDWSSPCWIQNFERK